MTRIRFAELVREAARWSVIARKQDALNELATLLERAEWIVNDNNITLALSDKLVRELALGYAPEIQ